MIVLDSGPLVAALNGQDKHHDACARLLRTYPGSLLVPSTVVTEVCQLVERRQGSKAEAAFLRTFGSGLTLVDLTEQDVDRMSDLVELYASLPLGAVDASVIAVAERLNVSEVATLDRRHFTVVRPSHTSALLLLPETL
ncbi:type II toxin-antitoxin system VapC family toxin [Nonomuraea bangladeshensis]|uniref:type II toxin-antitoxin system VapC family toxin n=1 Tax=Nonomuraea bangladeshensis TaxID=404385 RepID=UPI003C2D0580